MSSNIFLKLSSHQEINAYDERLHNKYNKSNFVADIVCYHKGQMDIAFDLIKDVKD